MKKVRAILLSGLAAFLVIVPSSSATAASPQSKEDRLATGAIKLFPGGEVKLISDEQHLPLIQVSINGSEPLHFVLDTGANVDLIMEPWVVKKLKLPPVPSAKPGDWQTMQVKSVVLPAIDRKNDIFVPVDAISVFDKNRLENFADGKIAGIIGIRFLLDKQLIINPDTKTISLLPSPTTPLPPATGKKVSLVPDKDDDDERFSIDCDVPGAGKVPFLLDTGANKVQVGARIARKIPLRIDSEPRQQITFEGVVNSHAVFLPEISFGPLVEKNIVGVTASSSQDNLLGMSLLKRFVVTIDFPRREMFLKPIKDYDTVADSYGKSGFTIDEKDKKVVIASVSIASLFFKNGISPDDEILAINGKKIVPGDSTTTGRLKEGRVGSRVTLQLRRKTGEVFDAEIVYVDPYESLDTPYSIGLYTSVGVSEDSKTIIHMFVTGVMPNSRAELAGMKEGDIVESVAGKTIAGLTFDELMAHKAKVGVGELVMTVKREGVEKPITIRIPGGNAKTLRDLL
jgi:predicted aspartyl protease